MLPQVFGRQRIALIKRSIGHVRLHARRVRFRNHVLDSKPALGVFQTQCRPGCIRFRPQLGEQAFVTGYEFCCTDHRLSGPERLCSQVYDCK